MGSKYGTKYRNAEEKKKQWKNDNRYHWIKWDERILERKKDN